ncbi:hypothetical protein GCM10007079_32110 [Nocardiopsis terrae]|uniref:Uncharacterized protein n=1 Tax=Nocardiopsis terrae TaxID=372655 RepID=A0ABR9HJ30_9ACTN|nr:hypothetical protein [Nocardiopsis terrae]MBE1459031.1 hypothetical protein [Nocardiopsis terrae]GHC87732.1 hypothetical protein GCM10007079_32110 [Nocardiopsis terrae]
MAEESAQLRHARPRGPRSNWVPLGVAAAVVAVLTLGWAMVNAALPATEALPSGHGMTLGSGEGYEASVTFDEDWQLDTGASSQGRQYLFTKGPVNLQMSVVTPPQEATGTELWEGLRDIVRVSDASAALGEPEKVTSDSGNEGLRGDLHLGQHTGTATVFPSPNGGFAVEARTVGTEAGQAELAEAEELVQSIRFSRSTGGTS